MNNKNILAVVLAVLLGVVVGYFMAGNDRYEMRHGKEWSEKGIHKMSNGEMMSSDGYMMEMDHMNMMVETEQEFLAGMIPHHQEAVDTAKEVVARGGSTPEIKALAENIIIAQEKEIADMKDWYQAWYGTEYTDTGSYQPMMRDLSNLSGAELDKRFLEDVIMHHMGAIMMAQSVRPYIEHQEIEDLTKAIVETQSDEIRVMQRMVKEL